MRIRINVDFLPESMQTRLEWNKIFKRLEETIHTTILEIYIQ